MPTPRFPVDVVMERVPLTNRWASERWQPVAVLPAGEPAPHLDRVEGEGVPVIGAEDRQWRFGGFVVELHRSEAEGYFLNLSSPEPKMFVMWRRVEDAMPPVRPFVVTASYNEAARMMDGGEQVDPVPLAPEVWEWVRPFMLEHYKGEPRKKARRNDPFAADADGARQGRGGRER